MYDSEEKLYPTLPSAPVDQVQMFRRTTIKDIETFLNKEIVDRSRLEKKFKHCSSVTTYLNYGLTTTSVITGGGGIASVATGIGVPVAIGLGAISLLSSLTSGIVYKLTALYSFKMQKHHDITVAAQTSLDAITVNISKALQDDVVNHDEFEHIVSAKQNYLAKKQELRSRNKKAVKELYEKQRQQLLEQGRREGREEVAKKLVDPSGTLNANAI